MPSLIDSKHDLSGRDYQIVHPLKEVICFVRIGNMPYSINISSLSFLFGQEPEGVATTVGSRVISITSCANLFMRIPVFSELLLSYLLPAST